jgi:hypothetical protein
LEEVQPLFSGDQKNVEEHPGRALADSAVEAVLTDLPYKGLQQRPTTLPTASLKEL